MTIRYVPFVQKCKLFVNDDNCLDLDSKLVFRGRVKERLFPAGGMTCKMAERLRT